MRVQLEENLCTCKALADEYFTSNEIPNEKKMDWIDNYCAQIALLTTQIAWTDDVHKAFDDIEGGMTNAMKICLISTNLIQEFCCDTFFCHTFLLVFLLVYHILCVPFIYTLHTL